MTAKPQVARRIQMFLRRAPATECAYGMHMLDRAQQMDAIAFATMKGSRCEETSVALLRRSFILEVLAWSRGVIPVFVDCGDSSGVRACDPCSDVGPDLAAHTRHPCQV